jgi:hypothetical protein
MKTILMIFLMVLSAGISTVSASSCCPSPAVAKKDSVPDFQRLKVHEVQKEKKNHWINADYYMTYEWDKKPRIGHHVLIVKLYSKDKKQVNDLSITADAYMPSMKGSHDTGDVLMKQNNKKHYLMPVHFMMLGKWELELKFSKDKKELTRAYVMLEIK